MTGVASVVRALAARYPWAVDPDPDVASALSFLDADVTAADVARAGYVGGAAAAAATWLLAVAFGAAPAPAALVAGGLGYGVARGVARLPPAFRVAPAHPRARGAPGRRGARRAPHAPRTRAGAGGDVRRPNGRGPTR